VPNAQTEMITPLLPLVARSLLWVHYILIAPVTAFFGAMLAIFLTSRFQHYFWKRQKREEIRLTVVTEVNRLAAEFKSNYLFEDLVETTSERTLTFAQSWVAVTGQVKDLFRPSTYQAFERMYTHVITAPLFSTQERTDRIHRIIEFDQVRETAMRALYQEIGILQDDTRWSRLKRRFESLVQR
jgi:hypothetical protein